VIAPQAWQLACFEFKPICKGKWLIKGISNMCWAKGFKGYKHNIKRHKCPNRWLFSTKEPVFMWQCGMMAMVKDNLLILNFVSLHMFAKFGQHPICGVKGFKNSYHSFFIDMWMFPPTFLHYNMCDVTLLHLLSLVHNLKNCQVFKWVEGLNW
jgi:hypothetical protein